MTRQIPLFLIPLVLGCQFGGPRPNNMATFTSDGSAILLMSATGNSVPMLPTEDPNTWEATIPTEWEGTMAIDPGGIGATMNVTVDFLTQPGGVNHNWQLLHDTTTVGGRVNWSDGTPIAGMTLWIEGQTEAGAPIDIRATTDAQGNYSLTIPRRTVVRYIRQAMP